MMLNSHEKPEGVSYLGPNLEAGLKRVSDAYGSAATVTESIYSGKSVIVPLADVQHIESWAANSVPGIKVITKHTRWDFDRDDWANAIWISEPEATAFRAAWCRYRSELERSTLVDLSPSA
jgi:hypothetical protein